MTSQRPKAIALHLPQFHPIPENDEWWGKGFTEWTNVVKGKPRFKGHYQPHLPQDLGYYDLRLPEAREAQAALAKQFGIYGFCYYHYWFNGRRILEKPVDAILESGEPDFPFMLCWANENWSRNWDGGFNKVLLEQKYSKEDFIKHARHLVKYFEDSRYIKIDGRPVFAIYKDGIGGEIEEYTDAFRAELQTHSINVFLCRFERRIGTTESFEKAFKIFDAGIEFQPLTRQFPEVKQYKNLISKLRELQVPFLRKALISFKQIDSIYNYQDVVENDLKYDFQQGWPIFPGVCPGWDNSPRRSEGSALIINDSTPELFKKWSLNKIKMTDWDLLPDRFIFVNAWNEWAEGNHLEPCERWGTKYLSAIQSAIREAG
ncbi:MAG: glycoside hydrolase family 99-like domain-containing protein [Desulfuromusa sp.]|nr:glycoside hydrolase family 99-like domain-containing protein [Desulfuromusa sp.]